MIERVESGVAHMSDIKTLSEVVEISNLKCCVVLHNIKMLKKNGRLIAGVDYLHTRNKIEKYTPVGITKIVADFTDKTKIKEDWSR